MLVRYLYLLTFFSTESFGGTPESEDELSDTNSYIDIPLYDSDEEELSDSSELLDCGIQPEPYDQKLYKDAPITVEESMISILTFLQSEGLTGAGLSKLVSLIELHCLKPNKCFSSTYTLFKQFESVKSPLMSHFYCSVCLKEIEKNRKCDDCKLLSPEIDQVIILSLKDQVSALYERPGFLTDIKYKNVRIKLNSDNLEDIYDGAIYKEAEKGILSESQNISFTWNTDGVSLYDSSRVQLWPFYLVVNELSPETRFKQENMILAACYIGKKKPNCNVFLKHVYENVMQLQKGFPVNVPGSTESINVKATIICGTCDSPAKAMVFNQKHFNGFYSCPICLSKGEKSERSENVFVHPFQENVELRTEEGYEQDVTIAMEMNRGVNLKLRDASHGIKGPTFLYLMVPSMLLSTSVDAMHCIYLGVMRQLLDLWFNKAYKDEQFSLRKVSKVVNHYFVSIKPPNFVKRLPRPLSERASFKAYEFLLFFFTIHYQCCILS